MNSNASLRTSGNHKNRPICKYFYDNFYFGINKRVKLTMEFRKNLSQSIRNERTTSYRQNKWMNGWMNEWLQKKHDVFHDKCLDRVLFCYTSSCLSDLWYWWCWNVCTIVYFWDVVLINFMNLWMQFVANVYSLWSPYVYAHSTVHSACLFVCLCVTFFAWIIQFFLRFANKKKWKSVDVHGKKMTKEEAKKDVENTVENDFSWVKSRLNKKRNN